MIPGAFHHFNFSSLLFSVEGWQGCLERFLIDAGNLLVNGFGFNLVRLMSKGFQVRHLFFCGNFIILVHEIPPLCFPLEMIIIVIGNSFYLLVEFFKPFFHSDMPFLGSYLQVEFVKGLWFMLHDFQFWLR